MSVGWQVVVYAALGLVGLVTYRAVRPALLERVGVSREDLTTCWLCLYALVGVGWLWVGGHL